MLMVPLQLTAAASERALACVSAPADAASDAATNVASAAAMSARLFIQLPSFVVSR
jgi:hypothetical protein